MVLHLEASSLTCLYLLKPLTEASFLILRMLMDFLLLPADGRKYGLSVLRDFSLLPSFLPLLRPSEGLCVEMC